MLILVREETLRRTRSRGQFPVRMQSPADMAINNAGTKVMQFVGDCQRCRIDFAVVGELAE